MARILAAVVLTIGMCACDRASPVTGSVESGRTAIVKRGDFQHSIRLNGTTTAVESYNVLVPRLSGQGSSSLIITRIVRNGTTVKKGDILVEFDRQSQEKSILDRQAEHDNYVQQIRKKKADHTAARIADETSLRSAEVDVKTALVEMRKNEIVPRYQAQIARANLAEAEAQLKQLGETFDLKRQAEAADLKILEIQRDRAQKALLYAQSNVEKMTVRSPMDGLVVLTPIQKGSRTVDPQEGDEVRAGGGLMQVVNPSAMQVKARINQVDIAQVRIGQSAEIRLDAYPDLVFPGQIERISAIGIAGSNSRKVRSFSSLITIHGRNPRLLPDLTAAVDVTVEQLKGVLMIPREAVIRQGTWTGVDVLVDGKFKRQEVRTGQMNDSEAVIESGLREGMVVSLSGQNTPEV